MTNIQAALGVAQMEELPEFIQRKQRNYELYKELFENFEYGKLIPFRKGLRILNMENLYLFEKELNQTSGFIVLILIGIISRYQ